MKTKKQRINNYIQPRTAGYQAHVHYETELEEAVLNTCIMVPGAFGSVYDMLDESCFYEELHLQVYTALRDMWQQGYAIDMLLLCQWLYAQGTHQLKGLNTHAAIAVLCGGMGSNTHLQAHCAQLRELSARRALVALTSSGLPHHDVLESAALLQADIAKAIAAKTNNHWQTAATAALAVMKQMDETGAGNDGISTTIPQLDEINGGLMGGQLIVLGARPSVGKSALATAIALQAAQQGVRVGLVSLEMPTRDVMARMACQHSGIPLHLLRKPQLLHPTTTAKIQQSMAHVASLPLSFSDASIATVHDIRARATQLKQQHGLGLLIVDYLQLIEEAPESGNRNREQGISQISRGLKLLAMELDIPVLALSQLNRASEHRQGKRPTLADLRESGAIEQDADGVLLLHRDERAGITHDAQGNPTTHQADIIVAKWRNGECFDIKLKFDGGCMRFGSFQ
jgi:Replicative DNA helicase